MNMLLTDDLVAVELTKGRDCVDIDERLELVDMGDAVRETKQVSPYPLYADSIYGVGFPG